MSQVVLAIFENGVLRPLEHLDLPEHLQVRVTVEPATSEAVEDPLDGLRVSTGLSDLAEHFDDYRFGRPTP